MKVNNNISAVTTNNQLLPTEDSLAKSMERLSSGLKINHAKDNPSGMAISNKMQAQINGLNQASRNSSDGTSVLETADGALNEVTSMLQRMRELAVQAANDTNSQEEKEAIQVEIDKLKEEVDRISSTTEFNTKNLLDGSLDNRVYAENVSRIQISEEVPAGEYAFAIDSAATQATITGGTIPTTLANSGTISINGYNVTLTAGMTQEEVYEAIRNGAEIGEASMGGSATDALSFVSTAYGTEGIVTIDVDDADLAAELGLSETQSATGVDAEITLDTTSSFSDSPATATVTYKGNKIEITDVGGFEMTMMLDAGATGTVEMNVTTMGPMVLQIGANEGQQMSVKIPACDTESLYIDTVDVTTVFGAARAITQTDEAIASVNKVRSSLGAYTNRLDSATASLDETSENMNSAISRISDVDMALEMTEYTRLNVLSQTATSALSQANELPQMALQLLQ
ncbi:MAG: flagellin [Lachnospiraceae bacterium]|nr:flagellin [Lachnospiraceae bacterium]